MIILSNTKCVDLTKPYADTVLQTRHKVKTYPHKELVWIVTNLQSGSRCASDQSVILKMVYKKENDNLYRLEISEKCYSRFRLLQCPI